jgi:tRNA(Ile)-lysidine synthase
LIPRREPAFGYDHVRAKITGDRAIGSQDSFCGFARRPVIALAVSGGPDSTALMLLAARWRDSLKTKPKLVAVTVDHGLRKESKGEATAVARLAREAKRCASHGALEWPQARNGGSGKSARGALSIAWRGARKAGAAHILTAHTLDDQAETVLIRMSRGSGLTGLGAMTRTAPLPPDGESTIVLVRPLLDIAKARLIATLDVAKIPYADDPSNHNPRFARPRLRNLMGALAEEGLDAKRLAQLAIG